MNATRKLSKVQEAYAKSEPARKVLRELDARCMEVIEDKCGIVCERYVLQLSPPTAVTGRFVNLVIYATPLWWDVFSPVENSPDTEATLAAIRALVQK